MIICPRYTQTEDMNCRCPDIPSKKEVQGYYKMGITYLSILQTKITRIGLNLKGYQYSNPIESYQNPKYNIATWLFPNYEIGNQFQKEVNELHDNLRQYYCCNHDIITCTDCFYNFSIV